MVIEFPPKQRQFVCTRCAASFDTRAELQHHFDKECDEAEDPPARWSDDDG